MRCLGLARFGLLLLLLGVLPVQAGLAPTAEPFVLTPLDGHSHTSPVLAARADGSYLLVWIDASSALMKGRFLGAGGAPLAPPFDIRSGVSTVPDVTLLPDGGFVAVWQQGGRILGSVHDREGRPRLSAFEIAPKRFGIFSMEPAVAAGPAGEWMVVWHDERVQVLDRDVSGRWYGPDGTPRTPILRLTESSDHLQSSPAVAARPGGGFLAVWNETDDPLLDPVGGSRLFGRSFDGEGNPSGPEQLLRNYREPALYPLPREHGFLLANEASKSLPLLRLDAEGNSLELSAEIAKDLANHSLTIDPAGTLLLVGAGSDGRVRGKLYDAAILQQVGETFEIPTWKTGTAPTALASSRPGHFLMVWQDPVSERLLGEVLAPSCPGKTGGLCLNQSRFHVGVSWRSSLGNTGEGKAVPLTDDTGSFWFFSPSNVELLVKVLDGRSLNGNFWVFYGSLSDVEYEIRVEDTLTGAVRTYRNPAGTLASHADVLAFPPSAAARETVTTVLEEIPVIAQSTVEPLSPPISCHGSDVALCLQPLYQVTVEFVDPLTGADRQARAVPFSQESGAFWFFDEDNLELFVKVLDGTAINGRAWVFHGALTDVEYTITVRDLLGAEWTYHNPRGRMHSGADTSALPPPLQF